MQVDAGRVETGVFKKLREEWMYWRFRNITRNRQRLRIWLRQRRPSRAKVNTMPHPRARGAALYSPYRTTGNRGLLFVAIVAAVLTVANVALPRLGVTNTLLSDLLLLFAITYAYLRLARV